MTPEQLARFHNQPTPRVPKVPRIKADTRPQVTLFTDGSYSTGTGDIGWGAVLKFRETIKTIGGYAPGNTKEIDSFGIWQAELHAVYVAIRQLKVPSRLTLVTDCQDVVAWLYGWHPQREQPDRAFSVRPALPIRVHVEKIHRLLVYAHHTLEKVEWVPSHSGHPENEQADEIAVRCRKHKIREMVS